MKGRRKRRRKRGGRMEVGEVEKKRRETEKEE